MTSLNIAIKPRRSRQTILPRLGNHHLQTGSTLDLLKSITRSPLQASNSWTDTSQNFYVGALATRQICPS